MNRRAWTGTCAAVVSLATAGMLAQTAPQTAPQTTPQTPQTPTQQSAPSSSANKITVTGCLKAAPTAATDTAGAANANPAAATGTAGSTAPETTGTSGASATPTAPGSAAATDAKFILTAATMAPAAADASSGAAANSAGTAQTYRLIANPTALSEHVGKKLELTGTLDPTSTADPKDPSAAAPALRVESGKIVAASCQ